MWRLATPSSGSFTARLEKPIWSAIWISDFNVAPRSDGENWRRSAPRSTSRP